MTFLCPLPVLLTERLSLMRPLCPLPLPLLLLTPWRVRLPHDTSVAPGLLVLVLFIALCGLAAAPFPLLVCEARVGAQCCYLCTRLFPAFFFLGNISPIDAYFLFSPFLTRVNNMQICRDSTTITTITTRRGTNCLCRCGRDCPCQSLKLPADSCTSERVYRFFFLFPLPVTWLPSCCIPSLAARLDAVTGQGVSVTAPAPEGERERDRGTG